MLSGYVSKRIYSIKVKKVIVQITIRTYSDNDLSLFCMGFNMKLDTL